MAVAVVEAAVDGKGGGPEWSRRADGCSSVPTVAGHAGRLSPKETTARSQWWRSKQQVATRLLVTTPPELRWKEQRQQH